MESKPVPEDKIEENVDKRTGLPGETYMTGELGLFVLVVVVIITIVIITNI